MIIQFVKFKSGLPAERVREVIEERAPAFRDVPGLVQKLYGREEGSGEVCGIYVFDSAESLAAFRASELARTIRPAYEATDPRVETFELLRVLHPDGRVAPLEDTAIRR